MNYVTNQNGELVSYHGIPVNIEIPIRTYRFCSTFAPVYMVSASYGEFAGTKGADGEPIDCYIGQFLGSEQIFIINQADKYGNFDEHKVMVGFLSKDDAISAYSACTNGLSPLSVVVCSPAQLLYWIKKGNKNEPITNNSFPFDPESENVMENNLYDWHDCDVTAAKALYDMRHIDTDEQLLEPATYDSVVNEISEVENGEFAVFDALAMQRLKLEKSAMLFGRVFNRSGKELQIAENGIQISEPFKKNGTTNIAMVFELVDGQTITCFLHNPDKTPNQLKPDDILVAWRWMLNKKDITILVAPEKGKDQNINEIGRRVMALAKKNSKRFTDANARRKQREENNRIIEERIASKEVILKDLMLQIELLQSRKDPVQQEDNNQAASEMGATQEQATQTAGNDTDVNENKITENLNESNETNSPIVDPELKAQTNESDEDKQDQPSEDSKQNHDTTDAENEQDTDTEQTGVETSSSSVEQLTDQPETDTKPENESEAAETESNETDKPIEQNIDQDQPEPGIAETTQNEKPDLATTPEDPEPQTATDSESDSKALEMEFLNNLISGTQDIDASDFNSRLDEIVKKYDESGDEQMESLLGMAIDAYASQLDKLSA